MASFLDQSYTYRPYRPENLLRKRFLGLLKIIALWFAVFQVINVFFVTSLRIDNESMSPVLQRGDKVLSAPLLYGPEIVILGVKIPFIVKPHRGDIVVASLPRIRDYPLFFRIVDPVARFFTGSRVKSLSGAIRKEWHGLTVKRLVGLPGDMIKIEKNVVYVKPEGEIYYVRESELILKQYITSTEGLPEGWQAAFPFSGTVQEFSLDKDEYFLLGDNRSASSDSRYWGPVSGRDLKGKVLLRYWPFNRFHGI